MTDKEIRHAAGASVEVREAESPTLTGYAALYGSETTIAGMFREVIRPGAFTAAIGRDDVRALYNHDPNFVLGRTKSGTLTLTEDERGLRYDVVLPNTLAAKDLHEQIKRGDISQSSFAFRVVRDSWPTVARGEMPLRQIEDVELFDVSPVTYPAYEATSVSARAKASAQDDPVVVPVVADPRWQDIRRRELALRMV
jgi:HK97 family phage prohead protease